MNAEASVWRDGQREKGGPLVALEAVDGPLLGYASAVLFGAGIGGILTMTVGTPLLLTISDRFFRHGR